MKEKNRNTVIVFYSIIIFSSLFFLLIYGYSFYNTSLEQRFFHEDYEMLEPAGLLGHGLGILGSSLIIVGVSSYMLRKRLKSLWRFGLIKNWLEFHIFLCTLGPILILFHTSFKFGGLVSISFWSMAAVFLSGIAGRFIYLQIPHSREGKALSLQEVRKLKTDLDSVLPGIHGLTEEQISVIRSVTNPGTIIGKNYLSTLRARFKSSMRIVNSLAKSKIMARNELKKLKNIIKQEYHLNRKIVRLDKMQNLFRFWHVAHMPLALVMLIIMLIHVILTVSLGYKWIF